MSVSENYSNLRKEIPSSATLLAAVKYASLPQIEELLAAGCKDLGFNTLQQLEEVMGHLQNFSFKPAFSSREENAARIHFIGHLQSNKIKKVLECKPYLIQSVDSLSVAEKIAQACKEKDLVQNILLQVRTDPGKEHGILPEDVRELAIKLHRSPRLRVLGLMTIPASEHPLPAFQLMKKLFDELQALLGSVHPLPYLSMGMSEDYPVALEEGATMIRIGKALFEKK